MKTNEITEKEYCLSVFEQNFQKVKGERIALYGTGANAKAILDRFPEYRFECIVDDHSNGKYIRGKYVVSMTEFLMLGIKTLIIAAQIDSAWAVFKRICRPCRDDGIAVYDMHGNDMFDVYRAVLGKQIDYSKHTYKDLLREIDGHDVISFDIERTLIVGRHLYASDFYEEIERELEEQGIVIKNLPDKIYKLQIENAVCSLQEICMMQGKIERMDDPMLERMIQIVNAQSEKFFYVRKEVVDALAYALKQGKKVALIDDMQEYRQSKNVLKEILQQLGISGYDSIISSADYKRSKFTGLYRMLKERYGDVRYLHIGDHVESDIVAPEMMGMDSFLIYRPFEINQMVGRVTATQANLDDAIFRKTLDLFIEERYKDVCFLSDIDAGETSSRAKTLESRLAMMKAQSKGGAEKITYTPVLYDPVVVEKNIDRYPKLTFKTWENPTVSIVVPVYNQFGYTYNCLKSILEYSEGIAYEVIIADDCSTDQVRELEKVVPGVTVIHNEKNLHFLLNCNNAAQSAKGAYILFLNNDTQVQPGWLAPLADLLDNRPDVGMVGSKLVYPDGHLQEAGGILWKDGSAWNYGHMKNPEGPEYSYLKEADYVSGAAIMIRAELWREIGGFDERFVPAYYEDVDLAFEVRRHGYKVMMHPASVVVHFEGVSNGTDTSTGSKAYQVQNQNKFYEKWKSVLEKEHFDNGQAVYLAKDRGQTKKQILVVDHYVPTYDKDAGSRCTYMYLKMFLKMGLKVTFIGDNFAKLEPYTSELNLLGVEILYGKYYYSNWEVWLEDNLQYFDYIYLQRPHIAVKYIDLVKKYARGKIFYYAVDLQYLRLYRDYLLSGDEQALEESKKWEPIEWGLFDKADVGHVVGSYEQAIAQEKFPGKPIRNIPIYIYDKMPDALEKDFSKRQDILYVGGFGHPPNIDAVLWFAKEIFPKILAVYPDIVWHIVGSRATQEIESFACKNIIIEGFVSDEELEALYRKCRLAVVPLRYGAGVKGKVVEASYYQIPLVTTSIGGEGLDGTIGSFVMEDDADKMAQKIIDLYTDYAELRKISDAGEVFIQKYFTEKVAEETLLADMREEE